jgi:hypothetical protein
MSAETRMPRLMATDTLAEFYRLWWLRARLRVGCAIIGPGWLGYVTACTILRQRARECITPDGQVILAKCQPLADALYAQIPGDWTLTATRTDAPPLTGPQP